MHACNSNLVPKPFSIGCQKRPMKRLCNCTTVHFALNTHLLIEAVKAVGPQMQMRDLCSELDTGRCSFITERSIRPFSPSHELAACERTLVTLNL